MKHIVHIIESERGWGAKVDETKEFDTWEKANIYVKEYNERHNPPLKQGEFTPDWYMYATYAGHQE